MKENNTNKRNIKCYRCKKMEHYSGECKIKKVKVSEKDKHV